MLTHTIYMHCDTLMQAWLHQKDDIFDIPEFMVDILRLQKGRCCAQFFAIFMPPLSMKKDFGLRFPDDDDYIEKTAEYFPKYNYGAREHFCLGE